MTRKTKIIATIGPASNDPLVLRKMIEAGMNVARLNFSHGTHGEHAERIANIRRIAQELRIPVAILQDLQGPKMRVGSLPKEGVILIPGTVIRFISESDNNHSNHEVLIPLDVPGLFESLEKGNRILIDDGKLEVLITTIHSNWLEAKVITGGKITSHKGVNLPGSKLMMPAFTEKDKSDLFFGLEQNVDAIAISFVRTSDDIELIRSSIKKMNKFASIIPLIAKLERPEAIKNLDSILKNADGVMVARGDLGVETSAAQVPVLQKEIIKTANQYGKLVITATQMLESMVSNPRPTRAEASDVANAIFDGTDAVMLSGETASGMFPVESISEMNAISEVSEKSLSKWGHGRITTFDTEENDAITMARAAREIAHDRNVASIAVFTLSGRTALLMSKERPEIPILAFTPDKKVYQKMSMYWGVQPFLVPFASNVEDMLAIVEAALLSSTPIAPGEQVVVISGLPVGQVRKPNFALLHTIGETN